jgi:hypothetical protein
MVHPLQVVTHLPTQATRYDIHICRFGQCIQQACGLMRSLGAPGKLMPHQMIKRACEQGSCWGSSSGSALAHVNLHFSFGSVSVSVCITNEQSIKAANGPRPGHDLAARQSAEGQFIERQCVERS